MASPGRNVRRPSARVAKTKSRDHVARRTQPRSDAVELGKQFYEQLRSQAEHMRHSQH